MRYRSPVAVIAAAVVATVAIPSDVEAMRVSDPAAAHEWRLRLRADLVGGARQGFGHGGLLGGGR